MTDCFWTDFVGCVEDCGTGVPALSGIFTQLGSVPPTLEARAQALDGKMYVFGGVNATDTPYTNMRRYDPSNEGWVELTPIPSGGRYSVSMIMINGKMYICGGQNGTVRFAQLWSYDVPTDQWSSLTAPPFARDSSASVSIDGKMYVHGGAGSGGDSNALWVYDPITDNWTQLANGPANQGCTATEINGLMYLLTSDACNLWVYDPLSNNWTQLATLPGTPYKYGASACTVGGKMYVYGGDSNDPPSADFWSYDPISDTWLKITEGPTEDGYRASCVIGDEWYLFGGNDALLDRSILQKVS